ncbi:hypothetical protein ABZ512_12285 [Nocardiopsis dassonvillei]|uniref:hypothetical protein n=1 Tax=Nocardiopsis dassonvillei TaxID=2014 RepID=UPI0033FA439B
MGFFRKKRREESRPSRRSTSSSSSGEERTDIRDPGLEPGDPRQLLFTLLKGCGLSFVLVGPGPVEETLEEAVRLVPALCASSRMGNGLFFRLDQDPETFWTAVESPLGSAVIVSVTPGSDSQLLFRLVFQPFERAEPPFTRQLITEGSTGSGLAALIGAADVAPAWEVAALSDLAASDTFPTLPASVRRAVRSWERVGTDLYRRQVRDGNGNAVKVLLTLDEGRPRLVTAIGETASLGGLDRLAPLTEPGPYVLEDWEGLVMVVRPVPLGVEEARLVEWSELLVKDIAAGFAALYLADTQPPPPEPATESVWERVEKAPSGSVPVRTFHLPAGPTDYTFTERVRESLPEEESTFDAIDLLARRLRESRGSGFGHAWRSDDDSALSPSWLTLTSAAVDQESGRVVGAGHLNHEAWDLPPAHDLGAIDGRNMSDFAEQGHTRGLFLPSAPLYIGSVRTGVLMPLDATVDLQSVDLHGATGVIAALGFLGHSTGAAFVYSPSGERRLLTVLEGITGTERIRFSGDGTWLLISGGQKSTLVEIRTGRHLRLEDGNTAWWPSADSTLLSVVHNEGTATPRLLSLESNTWTHSFPKVLLDVPLLPSFPHLWYPSVSPDGQEVLVQTPAGVTSDYQSEHGTGHRLARVELATGRGKLVHGVFLDREKRLERDVRESRWTGRAPARAVRLGPDLSCGLSEPVTEHRYLSPGREAGDAEEILLRSLNRAVDLTREGRDPSYLLPEILAALVPMTHEHEVWERRSEWVLGLQESTGGLTADGSIKGGAATAWRRYGSAITAIRSGQPELIDPLLATWTQPSESVSGREATR